ncbi:NHS-like protein 1 isoform X2 [Syngnathoides biaculeatus]|uniref:NHS-like protein 1 isoform X2 n=1 Tax=Syngnathoides biaculeatus TaxID=300417 RepID=UPI002ADDEF55|nr:NHS-like protein 1 isoform X2 [Syngnathoides biaculeatus]
MHQHSADDLLQYFQNKRCVEPRRASRLPAGGKARRAPAPFASLAEVGCHTLGNVIRQLADLSRLAADVFLGIEAEAVAVARRSGRLQGSLRELHARVGVLDPKKVPVPVSNLDEENKWTVHYKAPWHQQENVFLPGSRPPCVEDLHRQAKVNLKSALRECDKLRKDGFRSSQYYSQGPVFSDTAPSGSSLCDDDDDDDDDEKKSLASAEEEDDDRSRTRAPGDEADATRAPALPTPEERMRLMAQSVPTDIVPINVTASQGLGRDPRPHSMFVPGQYSTLGRAGSLNSTLRRSRTRDSGCQTEEVKVVPPSVRRIRAQRGQGIAAQMAGISASSPTGSIPVHGGDGSAVLTLPRQRNGDPTRFNSLPRQGVRVSLSADPICSSTPIKSEMESEDRRAPRRQIGKLRADDTAVHVRTAPRTHTLPRPRSQEVRRTQSSDWGNGPARVVSPHATYSTSLIPNATLSGSSEIIALSASGQRSRSPSSAYPTVRPLKACPAETASTPARVPPEGSRAAAVPAGESRCSDDSTWAPTPPSCQTEEHWIYDTPENLPGPHRTLTSSHSTPINQLYTSLEASSRTTTDSSSLYSQDNDGYYTSMHLDSGLRSRSHGAAGGRTTRHSMYECRETAGRDEYGDRSLSRSISLLKSKKPPPPPTRTDSLQRKPGPKKPLGGVGAGDSDNGTLNECLIASLQQSLQLGLKPGRGQGASPSSPSHSPSSDYDDPWVLRPRSRSSVSVGSSATSLAAGANGVSNAYSLCHVTPANSDTSSLRSDYADSWGFYAEYPRNHGEQSAQTPAAQTAEGPSTGPQSGERRNEVQEENAAVKAATSSPERVHRLTSPSSGYSSQSNTPTAGTPVPSGIRSASPSGGRPRPKVPERKSSLHSSMSVSSSSSTSLSSNTSDSLKSSGPPPQSSSSAPSTPLDATPPFAPAQPPQMWSPPPGCSSSPEFPMPPSPETLFHSGTSPNGSFSPPPPPPPPPVSLTVSPPPSSISFSSSPSPFRMAPAVPDSPTKSPALSITPFALQSVQLRSVRRTDSENSHPQGEPDSGHQEDSAPWPVSKLLEELSLDRSIARDAPDCRVIVGKPEGRKSCVLPKEIEERPEVLPGDSNPPIKQMRPVVAKKPKLPLNLQPVQAFPSPSEDTDAAPGSQKRDGDESEEEESCETSAEIRDESHTPPPGSDREPFRNRDAREDEDGTSTPDSVSSKEDDDNDAGDVFDPNPDQSPNGTRRTLGMVTPTPAAARTTEDLFAAIHRSKRKVLGRKESDEDKSRSGSHSPSPPATPPCGSSRPSGPIQRQLRKSSTSSDTFKALLLKKGSRSESSFRMSAAEMLRSTDPRSQRTRSECASPDPPSPPRSPRGKRAADEWRRYEALALSPPTSSAFRYGRSRTPPSAASSKYNARCRILSSPMTVICERDGEYADANGTLADDGGI